MLALRALFLAGLLAAAAMVSSAMPHDHNDEAVRNDSQTHRSTALSRRGRAVELKSACC